MERLRLAEEERSLVPAEERTFWEDLPSVVLRVHVAPAAENDDDADQQRATSTSKQRDALRRRKKNHSPPHRYFPLCVFLPVEAMNSLDVPDEEDFPIAVSLCRLSGVRCPPAEGEEDVSQTNRKWSAAITATAWIETGRQQALALAFPNYSKSAGVGKHVPSYSSSHFSLDELGEELLRNEEDGEVEDETDEVMEEEKNQLAVSACFAGQHGLRKGDIVRVRHLPKNVLALSRVVLMAKTKRAYRIASLQEDVFKHSLMINHQIVCRGGDVKLSRTQLPPPPCNDDGQTDTKHKEAQKQQADDTKEEETTEGFEDYAVLECHPLLQGLITSRSTIVVLPPMEPSSSSLHVDKVEDSNSAEKEYDKKSVGVIMTNDKSHQEQDEKEKEDEGPEARTPLLMSSFILPQARRLFLSSEDDDQESKQDDSDAEDNGIKQQKPQHHEHSTVSSMNGVSSGPIDEKRTEKRTKEEELNVGLLRGMISRPQPRTSWRDPLCEVGATFRTLRRLHVFSGSWIVLSCSTSGKSRLARVYVLSDNADSSPTLSLMFDRKEQEDVKQKNRALLSMKKDGVLPKDGTLYMSPFLFFNLGFDVQEIDVATVSVRPAVAISSSSSSIGERTTTPAPFFSATHVSIARVNSPASSGHVSYSRALVQHFKHPRLLCLGDVFPVIVKRSSPWHEYEYGLHDVERVETDAEDDEDDEYDDDEEEEKDYEEAPEEGKVGEENEQEWHELVHFKVVSIEPTIIPHESNIARQRTERIYCVTRKDSTLLQEGSVNSPVPPMMEHYLFRSPSILGDWEGGDDMGGLKEAWQELTSLVEPCLHPLSQRLGLTCSLLIHGPRANAKSRLVSAVAKRFGVHLLSVNCFDLLAPSEVQTEVNLRELFKEAELCSPSILFLRSLSAFDKASQQQQQSKDPSIAKLLRELIPSSETTLEQNLHRTTLNNDDDDYNDEDYSKRILVIATTDSIEELSASLRACFRHEMEVPSPSQKQRCQALVRMLEGVPLAMDVSPADIAMKTAAFVYDDLRTMVAHASSFAVQRVVGGIRGRLEEEKRQGAPAFNVNIPDRELEIVLCSAGVMLTVEDFDQAIGHLQAHHSVTMGAPKIPNVKWEDVGGLASVKEEILDTIQLPLKSPHLFSSELSKRSGVLLYGPPGTGKTLLAKAVATECSLNFLSVKGPELINMYVGESEKNVRDIFQKARNARPCVIFFDELDSLAPKRGAGADSGGVMDRVVSQLLTELNGLQKSADVFVIGATNRPDLLDPALLRPGRFDRLLYLGVSQDRPSQINILKALTRKFTLDESLDLRKIAEQCPFTFTGADFYALCSDAMLNAIREQIFLREEQQKHDDDDESSPSSLSSVTRKKHARTGEQTASTAVKVEEKHFLEALRTIRPSVSEAELRHYSQVQAAYQQNQKNARLVGSQ